MRKTFTIFACSLLLASIFSITYIPQNVTAGSPPPPDDGIDGLQYIDGDWNVNGVEIYTNETIVLTGNLIIEFGGNLTFSNVTLMMNCTIDGEFHIEVLSGGSFYIYDYDNDNTTMGDASNITAYNTNFEYLFWVREGSNFTMRNSDLYECGYDWDPYDESGLYIEADDVLIEYSTIGNGYFGIVSWYTNNTTIANSVIKNNSGIGSIGIFYYHSNGFIVNNLIINQNGIGAQGLVISYSSAIIENNTFRNNPIGMNIGIDSNGTVVNNTLVNNNNAINIQFANYALIKDNNISYNGEDGIYIAEDVVAPADISIINNTIVGNDFGIVGGSGPNYPIITNCTIIDSNFYDFSFTESYFNLTNTTFNKNKVQFVDASSDLSVSWFLHTFVQDSLGNPVPNANVQIRDNENGTFDKNYTTDATGHLNWTLITEYIQTKSSKTPYTPHNLTITKPGYLTAYADVEMNQSKYVTITLLDDGNPDADAGMDQEVVEGVLVYFDGSNSTDDVGIVWYNWTFGDGAYQNGTDAIVNHTYGTKGIYTVVLNVTDTLDQWGTDTCIVTVLNNPPTANAGPDQSVNEDEQVNFDGSGSTDDVGIIWYNWTFGDGSYDYGTNITTNHTYTDAGTYIVTLNVTDTISQWDEDTALVFVNNVGPTADAGSNLVMDEGEEVVFNASDSTDTSSDLPNLTYTWYFGDGDSDTGITVVHAYEDDGIYTATLIVTDDNGFVDSNTTIVTVNNVAPTIEPVPAQTIMEDSLFTLQVNATDVPGDTLTFSDNTTLLDINPITGMIEFTPTNDDVGNHSVNVTVVDDDGGVNYTVLNITVLNTNDQPVIESISQQLAVGDSEFTLQVEADDVDVGDVLTYSLTTYPTGMSIDGVTGLISWTPTNDKVGTHTVTVKVEDVGGLYDTETFTIIVSNVNDAPTIITTTLANATEDVFYMAFVHANDVDAGDSLIYSLDTYPAFISINPFTGMIFGTPGNGDVGTHDVIVNVTDGDAYATKTFSLTVLNVNDAPIIASNPVLTADIGVEYSYDIVASDEDNDALTYSLAEGLDGMAINGSKITWTPTNEQHGKTYQVVVEVTDGEATTTQSFVVSVGEIPEKTNYWLPLLLGLVGGLISGIIITWVMNQRKKDEEIEEYIEEIPEGGF